MYNSFQFLFDATILLASKGECDKVYVVIYNCIKKEVHAYQKMGHAEIGAITDLNHVIKRERVK